jgi:prepilin-type N-terminal cleavage/methylation domain-containing protein
MKSAPRHAVRGFTLIELLTVIAIIGILAGIIIPTTGAVRTSAKKAQTKAQFSQWSQAMVLYKQEYGFYPPVNRATYGTAVANKLNSAAFAAALTGKQLNGTAFASSATTADLFGNKKRGSFYAIADADLNVARTAFVDAFGNTDIVVVFDKDGNGMITANDFDNATPSSMPTVTSIDGTTLTPAPTTNLAGTGATATGPRASVIFYSAGKGGAAKDIVYSWE